MGRPAKFDRDDAIAAAMDLFWENGFEATGVSELAAAIGITRSSFYNSFESREKLFEVIIAKYATVAPDRVLDGVKPGDPVLPTIEILFRTLCHARANDPQARGCLVVNCVAEMNGTENEPPLIRDMLTAKIDRFEALLEQARDCGELPADVAIQALAAELVAFLMGLNTLSKIVREEERLWDIARSFLKSHALMQ